jgi:TolA-binding protein
MVDHSNESGSSAASAEGPGSPEAQFKHPHPAPQSAADGSKHPVFPMLLGAALLLTLVVAWIANTKPQEPEAAATAPAPAATADAAAPKPPDTEAENKALKSAVDALQADLKGLQDRIESLPKPSAAVNLEPISAKLNDLAKSTGSLATLPAKVSDIDQRLDALDKTLATLRGDVDTLRSDVKKAAEAAPAPAVASAPDADAAVDQAAGLFKAGKYKEASDAFQKLTESSPGDARVWYFAALSRGSATGQWTGETTRLAEKGVDLEKSGTPPTAKIDAVFADLNPNFKTWFDYYRNLAKPR